MKWKYKIKEEDIKKLDELVVKVKNRYKNDFNKKLENLLWIYYFYSKFLKEEKEWRSLGNIIDYKSLKWIWWSWWGSCKSIKAFGGYIWEGFCETNNKKENYYLLSIGWYRNTDSEEFKFSRDVIALFAILDTAIEEIKKECRMKNTKDILRSKHLNLNSYHRDTPKIVLTYLFTIDNGSKSSINKDKNKIVAYSLRPFPLDPNVHVPYETEIELNLDKGLARIIRKYNLF